MPGFASYDAIIEAIVNHQTPPDCPWVYPPGGIGPGNGNIHELELSGVFLKKWEDPGPEGVVYREQQRAVCQHILASKGGSILELRSIYGNVLERFFPPRPPEPLPPPTRFERILEEP